MKKATLILMLSLASLCIQAQETRPVQTVVCQDEQFLLDTSYNEREDRMNFEFHASDSIVLDPGFSRKSLLSSTYYTMDLTVDVLGVYPPGHGLQGGPDEADTGYVGAIGGTVDVSAMGGATYTIPLELPAGINGMQPSLALVYNSQGGNGLLGWKWDLAGLSSITRTGKTRYHDGAVGGVTLNDQTDRFMLDGQRLIQVHDYGDSVDYKTEQDGMARIRAYLTRTTYNLNGHVVVTGHIDNFKVWNPDGTVCEYGFTEDSRIDPQNGKVYALCWLLNKVSDRNGNAIVYHYEELQQSGQFYISSIEYTENESLSIKPEFIVCFGYIDKSDYEFGYVAGNIVQQKRLLSSVTLKKTSGKTLSNYSFRYTKTADYANSRYCSNRMYHRLTGVTLEKGGMTMNPTQIVWEYDESSTHHDGQVFDLDTTYFNNFTFVGDFNADGFSDVLTVPYKTGSVYPGSVDMNVLINQGDGAFEYNADLSMNTDNGHPLDASLDWVHIIDLNDDGYDDVIMQYFTQHQITQETNLMVYMNQRGERFVPAWESPLHMRIKLYLVYGDFFGEGKQSALVFTYAMFNDVQNNIVPVLEPYYYIHCDNEVCSFDRVTADPMTTNDVTVGDFNGDGRTEILMVHRNEAWMYDLRHNGGGFLFHTIRRCPEIRYVPELNLFPGDYNGDGKEDLLCYGKNSESSAALSWFFLFSTGNSFNIEPTAIFLSINLSPSEKLFTYSLEKVNENNTFAMFASDFDGDGLCDVAVSRNEGNHSSVVVYSKFVSSTFMYYYGNHNHLAGGHNPLSCASVYGFKARSQYIHVGNFFGKDNMSFLATEITTHNNVIQRRPKLCTLYSLHEFNSVTCIIDGLGNKQRLSYKYPTVCGMPRTDMGNGIVKLNVPIRTLKATRTYRVDAPFTTSYNFENAVYHKDGHGYLGFLRQESVCMINNQDVSKHISEFETATMGAYAFSLPKEDNTYVYLDGSWKNSAKSEYSFRNIVSSLKPAMTNQCTIRFNIDNPSVPNECLRKEITEYDYSFATDGTYSDAYNCTETRVGVSGQNIGNYSQCEFKLRSRSTSIQTTMTLGQSIVLTTRRLFAKGQTSPM